MEKRRPGAAPAAKPQRRATRPKTRDAASRPMTGFFASLTPTQQQAALAYDGPDTFRPDPDTKPDA